MIFQKSIKLDFICMKMKQMKNKKIFGANVFMKGTWMGNRFYV